MNRKIIALIVLGVVLLACLLACGFFGVKSVRRTRLRHAAMIAYEKKEYVLAERLLRAYTQQDPNAEAEFVALANIYREFDNPGMETQMWQTACSLNPLNREYYENMLTSAVKSVSYALLHGILGRKVRTNEQLTDRELYLYVISSFRSGYPKDGEESYKKALEADPEAFHKDELGRMAEFMAAYGSLSEAERDDFLNEALKSDDPMIRFEALYTNLSRSRAKKTEDDGEDDEPLLKQIAETNYFAGTPLLADYCFAKYRFSDVIALLEPYLKTIDDLNMSLLYVESCVFAGEQDKIQAAREKLRGKTGVLRLLADYCDPLIAFMENDEDKLASAMRKSGKLVSSPLSKLMRLRVAVNQNTFNEIVVVAEEIFNSPPFHDLHNRAMFICLNYLSEQMKKPENQNDPSQMAELAKILANYLHGNRLLTEIVLTAQYRKGVATETDLINAMEQFPDDLLLARITAEYLIFNDKSEQAIVLIEQVAEYSGGNGALDFLYILALEQVDRHDEAAELFRRLVEQSEFDLNLLADYFTYCREHERGDDLADMAAKLENASDDKLKPYAAFFRAAALMLEDDEAKKQEALKLLAASPNDIPVFTFYAANRLCEADMLDEAVAKYKAIEKTYPEPSLIFVNLSEIYKAKGEAALALNAAKEAFDMGKKSMLPAYIYAQRLSEAGRYEEAVDALKFPRHAVNYREEVVELWTDCMKKVIEKSIAEQRFLQAEEQCKHLLAIDPDDEFGRENLEKVREILHPKKGNGTAEEGVPAA